MNFKSLSPSLGSSNEENLAELLGYIEDLKTETEARITFIETTIERIKAAIDALGEESV